MTFQISYIKRGLSSILLNKAFARRHVLPHQNVKDFVGLLRVFDGYPLQRPLPRIHGGLPQLFGIHFSETLYRWIETLRERLVFSVERLVSVSGASASTSVSSSFPSPSSTSLTSIPSFFKKAFFSSSE